MKTEEIEAQRDKLVVMIAEALATYEIDEPHNENDPVGDETIAFDEIVWMGSLDHEHKQSITCRKCLADNWMDKAIYIASRLEQQGLVVKV